jgi:hypothetical protein
MGDTPILFLMAIQLIFSSYKFPLISSLCETIHCFVFLLLFIYIYIVLFEYQIVCPVASLIFHISGARRQSFMLVSCLAFSLAMTLADFQ